MQSVYRAAIGRARTPERGPSGRVTQFPRRGLGSSRSSLSDREERLGAVAIFGGAPPGAAALLGLRETRLGIAELLFQRGDVEVLRADCLLDQQPGPVAEDLQPAMGLRVANRLRVV